MICWNGIDKFGFAPLSRAFLQNYRLLNITMEEAMLIMHLLDHLWLGKNDFPSAKLFAQKTGKSQQAIRAYFKSLRFKGYLLADPESSDARHMSYDYQPLLEALKNIANVPEEQEQAEDQEEFVEKSENTQQSELGRLVDVNNKLAQDKRFTRVPVTTKPSHWKRVKSFVEKQPSQYNAKDIELLFASEWEKKTWRTAAPRFYGKDMKHAKELIKNYGAEDVTTVISSCIQNWETIAPKFNIRGYPSMAIFWGFRSTIFPTIIDGEINQKDPSWGSHYKGHETEEGKEVGWF